MRNPRKKLSSHQPDLMQVEGMLKGKGADLVNETWNNLRVLLGAELNQNAFSSALSEFSKASVKFFANRRQELNAFANVTDEDIEFFKSAFKQIIDTIVALKDPEEKKKFFRIFSDSQFDKQSLLTIYDLKNFLLMDTNDGVFWNEILANKRDPAIFYRSIGRFGDANDVQKFFTRTKKTALILDNKSLSNLYLIIFGAMLACKFNFIDQLINSLSQDQRKELENNAAKRKFFFISLRQWASSQEQTPFDIEIFSHTAAGTKNVNLPKKIAYSVFKYLLSIDSPFKQQKLLAFINFLKPLKLETERDRKITYSPLNELINHFYSNLQQFTEEQVKCAVSLREIGISDVSYEVFMQLANCGVNHFFKLKNLPEEPLKNVQEIFEKHGIKRAAFFVAILIENGGVFFNNKNLDQIINLIRNSDFRTAVENDSIAEFDFNFVLAAAVIEYTVSKLSFFSSLVPKNKESVVAEFALMNLLPKAFLSNLTDVSAYRFDILQSLALELIESENPSVALFARSLAYLSFLSVYQDTEQTEQQKEASNILRQHFLRTPERIMVFASEAAEVICAKHRANGYRDVFGSFASSKFIEYLESDVLLLGVTRSFLVENYSQLFIRRHHKSWVTYLNDIYKSYHEQGIIYYLETAACLGYEEQDPSMPEQIVAFLKDESFVQKVNNEEQGIEDFNLAKAWAFSILKNPSLVFSLVSTLKANTQEFKDLMIFLAENNKLPKITKDSALPSFNYSATTQLMQIENKVVQSTARSLLFRAKKTAIEFPNNTLPKFPLFPNLTTENALEILKEFKEFMNLQSSDPDALVHFLKGDLKFTLTVVEHLCRQWTFEDVLSSKELFNYNNFMSVFFKLRNAEINSLEIFLKYSKFQNFSKFLHQGQNQVVLDLRDEHSEFSLLKITQKELRAWEEILSSTANKTEEEISEIKKAFDKRVVNLNLTDWRILIAFIFEQQLINLMNDRVGVMSRFRWGSFPEINNYLASYVCDEENPSPNATVTNMINLEKCIREFNKLGIIELSKIINPVDYVIVLISVYQEGQMTTAQLKDLYELSLQTTWQQTETNELKTANRIMGIFFKDIGNHFIDVEDVLDGKANFANNDIEKKEKPRNSSLDNFLVKFLPRTFHIPVIQLKPFYYIEFLHYLVQNRFNVPGRLGEEFYNPKKQNAGVFTFEEWAEKIEYAIRLFKTNPVLQQTRPQIIKTLELPNPTFQDSVVRACFGLVAPKHKCVRITDFIVNFVIHEIHGFDKTDPAFYNCIKTSHEFFEKHKVAMAILRSSGLTWKDFVKPATLAVTKVYDELARYLTESTLNQSGQCHALRKLLLAVGKSSCQNGAPAFESMSILPSELWGEIGSYCMSLHLPPAYVIKHEMLLNVTNSFVEYVTAKVGSIKLVDENDDFEPRAKRPKFSEQDEKMVDQWFL